MPQALLIRDLVKTYNHNTQKALDGLCLSVEEGDFYALLGPNGAGKSTTIGILTGLIQKDSGFIQVMAQDWDANPLKARSYLGVVPQEFNFNGFERVEDILYQQAGYYGVQRSVARIQIERLLKQLDLNHKRHVPARTLSGGMKRRLMIARGLVHQPKILLLDEPTAGVDVVLRHTLWAFLKKLNQEEGITIILTTHYLEEAEYLCRHVGILHQGRLVRNLPKAQLLAEVEEETLQIEVEAPTKEVSLPAAPLGFQITWEVLHSQISLTYPVREDLGVYLHALHSAGFKIKSLKPTSTRLETLLLRWTHLQEGK